MTEALHRAWRWRMRIPLFLALIYILPGALMPLVSYDLREVKVLSAPDAMGAWVSVDRATNLGGYIRFKVGFHTLDGLPVCTPRWSDPFPYAKFVSGTITKPLWWWAGGKDVLQRCVDEGLLDGLFYATTCHELVTEIGEISYARRCKRSNIFMLGGPSDAGKF